ncbi:MAG: O-antigen ligase family protein [Caldilineaceae bacterium]|nr:O-antigen ligase family protein [Caldilineaceae bacterium]
MVANSISTRPRRRRHQSWLKRLLWLEPFWLLLLAPSLLFTDYFWEPTARPLLIVALFLFWPMRLKAKQPLLPGGAAGWFIGFLFLWLPVTIWPSVDSDLSWMVAGYIYFALAAFIALIHWPPLRQQPGWLVLALLLLGVGLAMVGPELFSINPDKMLDVYRSEEFTVNAATLAGETINPNILAGALVFIMPLSMAFALYWPWPQRRWLSLLGWVPVLIMGNALLLSQSRSGWLALLVSTLLLCWVRWPRPTLLLLGSGLLVGTVALWQSGLWDGLANANLIHSAQASLTRRLGIWQLSLQLLGANGITGIGLGVYEQVFALRFPTLPLVGGRLAPPHAHNLFVQLALDLGIPGLVAYLGLLATLIRSLYHTLQAAHWTRHPQSYPLALGVSGAFMAMLVVGTFDNALWGTKLTFIPWSIFALAFISETIEKPNDSAI